MTASSGRAPRPSSSRVCLLAASGVLAVWVAALAQQHAWSLSRWYPATATGLFGCVAVVALAGIRRHHPFPRVGPANLVTGLRATLVALVGAAVVEAPSSALAWALVVTAGVAAAMDLADGWLARQSRMASAFGARFDMEVDALLILVLAVLVWRFEKAGVWVVASGLLRYAFVLAGKPLPWLARALPFSRRRQAICVVQIVTLIAALAPLVSWPLSEALAALGLAALAWSFGVDVWWLARARDETG